MTALAWPVAANAQDARPRTYVPNDCVPAFGLDWGWCGDGGPAMRALVLQPLHVTAWADGAFAFSSNEIAVIRKVGSNGVIDVAAGTGTHGFSGDGGRATRARISVGADVAGLPDGGFLIADTSNHRVRHVGRDAIIRTVAGTGRAGSAGDNGPATAARLNYPTSVDPLPGGGFLIGDSGNARVRRVAPDGTIATALVVRRAAGTPFTRAAVAALPAGGFVVAEEGRVRRVGADGTVRTIHNRGVQSVATLPDGSPAILDGHQLRALDPPRSIALGRCASRPFVAVATGDGGPAARAIMRALDVAALPDGSLLVSDRIFQRIRRISPDGRAFTVAGGGGLTGPVPQWHTCEGAGNEYTPPWHLRIGRVGLLRRVVRVRIESTLRGTMTAQVRRPNGRTVARLPRPRVVDSGRRTLHVRGVRPGRYTIVVRGVHTSNEGQRVRVRREVTRTLR